MLLTVDHLRQVARASAVSSNMKSVVVAVSKYGPKFNLAHPHRLAHFIAQLAHESAGFRYDQEIWGDTPAQLRYDTRTDLGNSPERDGDGKKYKGHGPIQVTGKFNHRAFRDWCRSRGLAPPDFVKSPGLINTDPWEGLSAIWYWETKNLNKYADRNDIEMVTRRINGGLNGYADRLDCYTRTALVLLGYPVTRKELKGSIRAFQHFAKPAFYDGALDGIDGPKTRAALHKALVRKGQGSAPTVKTQSSPVIEVVEKKVAVAPVQAEKTGKGVAGLVAVGAGSIGSFLPGLSGTAQIMLIGAIIVLVGLMITGHLNLAKVIRTTRAAIES